MSEVRIHVAVAESLHREAKAAAAKSGRTLKQLVIDALAHEIGVAQPPRTEAEVAADLDELGMEPHGVLIEGKPIDARPKRTSRRDVQPRLKGGKG